MKYKIGDKIYWLRQSLLNGSKDFVICLLYCEIIGKGKTINYYSDNNEIVNYYVIKTEHSHMVERCYDYVPEEEVFKNENEGMEALNNIINEKSKLKK